MTGRNTDPAIGPRIKRARQAAGLTQSDLAQMIGAHRDSVSNWETGKHTPDGYTPKIEEALGVSLEDHGVTAEEQERLAETENLEAVLDALRMAEKQLDRARAVIRRLIADS